MGIRKGCGGLSCIVWVNREPLGQGRPLEWKDCLLPQTGGLFLLDLPSEPKTRLGPQGTLGYRGRVPQASGVSLPVLRPALTHQAVQCHHLLVFIDVHGVYQDLKEA